MCVTLTMHAENKKRQQQIVELYINLYSRCDITIELLRPCDRNSLYYKPMTQHHCVRFTLYPDTKLIQSTHKHRELPKSS
jgi:hypothetical protein